MKKRVIRIVVSVLLILAVVFPLSAFDGGGQLDTNLSLGGRNWFTDEFSGIVGLSEKGTAWLRIPLPLGTLSVEGSWTFSLGYGFVWPFTLTEAQVFSMANTLDISLAKYNLPISISDFTIDINVGRFAIADSTGLIFSQNIDGVYLSLPFKLFSVSAGAGYTGLLNAKTTGVYGVPVTTSTSSIYEFAPGYVAVLSRLTAPNLIGGQSFDAEANLFLNLNTVSSSDGLSRSFVTVSAHGPIIPLIYYNAAASVGVAFGSAFKTGIMGKAGITFYPNFLSSALTFTTLFATADFLPFTDLPVSSDGKRGCSDILKLSLSYSMKPVDKWLTNLEGAMLYSSSNVDSFELDTIQGNLSAKYQWFSDVCVIATSGLVIPINDTSNSYFSGSVRIQLSF